MAGNIKGITIEIDGNTSKLDKALRDVNKTSRDLNKELRDIKKSMKFNPDKSAVLMTQQQRALAKAVENTKKKLETLKEAQKQAQEALKRGDIGQDEYDALTREIYKTENQLKSLKRELDNVNSSWYQAGQKMQEFGGKMTKVGDKISSVGKGLTTKLTLPLTAFGAHAVKLAAEFESAMSEVQAISGATAEEMEVISSTARELGATTVFSAKEAAEGMKYLAMAGWDTQEMISGMPGLLDLAAASGTELGRTADIVTDSLSGFGMQASEAGRLADVMAVASSSANTNVEMMGETFKYVAPLAGALGYEVEDVAVVTGLMANAGIKAGQAGTTMRTAFTRLASPTKEVSEGLKMIGLEAEDLQGLSLDETVRTLRNAFADLDSTQQAQAASMIFGKQSMSGMLAVINASEDEYNSLSDAIYASDRAAQEMAKTMNDNMKGALKELNSAFEEAQISLGEVLAPMIRDVAEKLTELVQKFNELDDGTKETIVKFGLIAAALGPVIFIFGQVVGAIGKIISALGGIVSHIGVVKGVLVSAGGVIKGVMVAIAGALSIPVGAAVALVAALVGIGVVVYRNWETIKEKSIEIWTSLTEWLTETWNGIKETASEIWNGLKDVFEFAWLLVKEVFNVAWLAISTPLILAWEVFMATAETIWSLFSQIFEKAWGKVKDVTTEVWEGIKSFLTGIWDSIKSAVKPFTDPIVNGISKAWDTIKDTTSKVWNTVKTKISDAWSNIKSKVSDGASNVKSKVSDAWSTVKSNTQETWENVKSTISSKWDGIKSSVSSSTEGIRSKISNAWDNIKSTTKSAWDAVKRAIETPINRARDLVQNAVNRMKSILNITLPFPKIKLPHFSVSGSFSLRPPSVPRFSVNWYKDGGIFDRASIIGVGEAGSEAVLPTNKLDKFLEDGVKRVTSNLSGSAEGETKIIIENMQVRSETDIEKIARELDKLRTRRKRGGLNFA